MLLPLEGQPDVPRENGGRAMAPIVEWREAYEKQKKALK